MSDLFGPLPLQCIIVSSVPRRVSHAQIVPTSTPAPPFTELGFVESAQRPHRHAPRAISLKGEAEPLPPWSSMMCSV